jgi:hypothetical protein
MPDCRGLWERRSREGRSVGLCEGGDRSYAGKSEPTERAMSENRPTRTYDDECPKHPVFGDCALVDGPLFGGRPNCRLQHLRPDRPHHASGSHRTEPIENADRSKRKGASRYTVLRGRSAATSALDNGDLLIEGLRACLVRVKVSMVSYAIPYEKDISNRPLRCPVDPFAILLTHPKSRRKTTHPLLARCS